MFKTYGTHQDQIRRVSESMRALYRIPKTPTVRNAPGIIEQCSTSLLNTGIFHECLTRAKKEANPPPVPCHDTGLLEVYSHGAPVGVKCRCCGDNFLELDFAYTKKSGLCIPCWENGVIRK